MFFILEFCGIIEKLQSFTSLGGKTFFHVKWEGIKEETWEEQSTILSRFSDRSLSLARKKLPISPQSELLNYLKVEDIEMFQYVCKNCKIIFNSQTDEEAHACFVE